MTAAYRADIDGLRAMAVLSVVLYHAGVPWLAGGFTGVDVFFVISGFLITRIIVADLAAGAFSFSRFYERRIRRLFPALAFTLSVTLVGAALLNPPGAFGDFGRSLTQTAAFVSNVGFWRDTGYFAAPAASLPLLHTWSLSVEEQFYILYPVSLMLIWRYGHQHFARWIALLAIVSLGASIYVTQTHQVAAFYLSPFRAWELMIGALLGVGAIPMVKSRGVRTALGALGVTLILASAVWLDETVNFPGVWALFPTCGAGLVIYAGQDGETSIGRFLGQRPFVLIGLMSYSLYLLHWPVLVMARQLAIVELTPRQTVLTMGIATVLTLFSWHFVERPFRAAVPGRQRRLFVSTAVVLTLFAATGMAIVRSHGVPRRFASAPFAMDVGPDSAWVQWNTCEGAYPPASVLPCRLGTDKPADFALWGDSHALALASGVSSAAARTGASGALLITNGCPPLLGVRRIYDDTATACVEANQAALRYLQANPRVQTVILAGRWSLYWVGRPRGEYGETVRLGRWPGTAPVTNAEAMADGLIQTVQALRALGRRVAIVRPVPEIGYDVPNAAQSAYLTGRDFERILAPTRDAYQFRNRRVLGLIDSLRLARAVEVVAVDAVTCDAQRCHVTYAGRLLYRDDDHLSTFASLRMSGRFIDLFRAGSSTP